MELIQCWSSRVDMNVTYSDFLVFYKSCLMLTSYVKVYGCNHAFTSLQPEDQYNA